MQTSNLNLLRYPECYHNLERELWLMRQGPVQPKINILFLDIDGVLWTVGGVQYHRYWKNKGEQMPPEQLDPVQLAIFEDLCRDVPNLKVVVSSTWRHGTTVAEFCEYFGHIAGPRVIGVTPTFRDSLRGEEIASWFTRLKKQHPNIHACIDTWATVDDDSDMWPQLVTKSFFQTSCWDGMGFYTNHKLQMYFKGTVKYRRRVHIKNTVRWYIKGSAWYFLVKRPILDYQRELKRKYYWPRKHALLKWFKEKSWFSRMNKSEP